MPDSWYLLQRFWLRVDQVHLRAFESRFFHDLSTNYILREFSAREMPLNASSAVYKDPNQIIPSIPLTFQSFHRISLPDVFEENESITLIE